MKVALVCDWLTNVGGAEKVLLEIHRLYPKAPIYTSQYSPKGIDWFADADVRTGWLQIFPVFMRRLLSPLRQQWFKHLNLSEYDLIISVTGAEAKAVKAPEAEAKTPEADAEKAKRAAIFDKIVADKEKAPTEKAAVSEEKKTAKETVKMPLDEFAGPKKASERGIKIAAAREAAAKKQEKSVDLGFTEISKEDIKEANKNVKKPIIGAHRKK